MNILIVNYEFPPLGGGGGIGCYLIAKKLAKKHHIDVLTSNYGNKLVSREKKDGLTIYRVPAFGRKSWQSATFFSMLSYIVGAVIKGAILRRKKYNLIHTYFGLPSGIVGVTLSKFLKVPHILTLIGGEIFDQDRLELEYHRNPLTKWIMLWVSKNSDYITAISTDTANGAKDWLGLSKRITILPLPIGRPNIKIQSKIFKKKVKLITVCRLIKRKGVSFLIEWLKQLDSMRFELHIIGDGEELASLMRLVNYYQLNKQVFFHGFVTEERKYELLRSCDIFVLSSMHEGLGICFLEAMYCGLPIVAYNNGGHRDFLIHGKHGFFTPLFDIEKSVKAIRLLINDRILYCKISRENQKQVKNFLSGVIVPKYEDFFSFILNSQL